MDGIINGADIVLYKDGTAIAYTTNASIRVSHSTRDASNKTDGKWARKKEGRLSWGGNASGWVAFADDDGVDVVGIDDLLADIIARTKVVMKASTDDSGDVEYSGNAYLTEVSFDSPDQESSPFNITWDGDDALAPATIT